MHEKLLLFSPACTNIHIQCAFSRACTNNCIHSSVCIKGSFFSHLPLFFVCLVPSCLAVQLRGMRWKGIHAPQFCFGFSIPPTLPQLFLTNWLVQAKHDLPCTASSSGLIHRTAAPSFPCSSNTDRKMSHPGRARIVLPLPNFQLRENIMHSLTVISCVKDTFTEPCCAANTHTAAIDITAWAMLG